VFQEWFDINYTSYEDPRIIFDDYYANNLSRINNLDKANTPKQNNNDVATKPVLCKKVSLLFIKNIKGGDLSNLF